MPEYEYESPSGKRRSVFAQMSNIPPERIVIDENGSWGVVQPKHIADGETIWTRIYTTGAGYVNRFSAWRSPVSGRGLEGNLDKNSGR